MSKLDNNKYIAERMWLTLHHFAINASDPKMLDFLVCSESVEFIKAHPSLKDAWDSCTVPSWLRWWLRDWLQVYEREFNKYSFSSEKVNEEACDDIRRTFTYWGERIDCSPGSMEL